ncbi:MAG: hypothetical protein NXH87_07680 [Rhodobiaceae bacterium]|nr:hypothetical protein RHODOSMS8_01651 [Rhodobiaceae bacterium]MCR9241244.1 hypothetical protein [Rhodobiaceae bacterium]
MRTLAIALCITGGLALSACTTPEQRASAAAAQQNADEAECTTLGFQPQTEAFADCLLRLREIRSENAKTRALNNARRDPFWPWYRSRYRYPYRYW